MNREKLVESCNWRQFLESTASALQINISFFDPETGGAISVYENCPICNKKLPPVDFSGLIRNHEKDTDNPYEVFSLHQFKVVMRDLSCRCSKAGLPFSKRTEIAEELLSNFYTIIIRQWDEDQLLTELATIRHINYIILSMFRGERKALELALDLILSAAVIIFEAEGSWLQYEYFGNKYLITKGKCKFSGGSISENIKSSVVNGRICIETPADINRAAAFLDFTAQECALAFEIDYLLKLLETSIGKIMDAVDSIVFLVSEHMRFCFINKTAEKYFCKSKIELLGSDIKTIETPWNEALSLRPAAIKKGIKDELSVASEVKYVDWSIYPLTDVKKMPGWLIVAEDRTHYYRMQEIGERVERFVNTFTLLDVLTHEIRNPLATFKGVLQLIRVKNDPESINKYTELGLKEVDRVTCLLNDIMVLGRPPEINKKAIDLKSFLNDKLTLLKTDLNYCCVNVITDFNSVPEITADHEQLTQLMLNILKNAFESVNKKGKIFVSLDAINSEWIRIAVRDTGPGIPEHLEEKIFQPFYTTKAGGTGLGLPISRAIVENHGGKIFAANHAEGGAEFSIVLPTKEHFDKIYTEYDVVFVSNEELVCQPVEQVLKAGGFNVLKAKNQKEALYLLSRYGPSVIAADISLFSLSFYKAVIKRFPKIKFLIIGDDCVYKEFQNVTCIAKPLDYTKLLYKIYSLTKNKK